MSESYQINGQKHQQLLDPLRIEIRATSDVVEGALLTLYRQLGVRFASVQDGEIHLGFSRWGGDGFLHMEPKGISAWMGLYGSDEAWDVTITCHHVGRGK